MREIISKAALEARRARYKPGTRVELVRMDDPYTKIAAGTKGIVIGVDSIGTCNIQWDDGSTLGAAYGADEITVIPSSVPDDVRDEILKLRTLPGCPNMFDTNAVQRLAFEHGLYSLVNFIETDRKAYSRFILTGE